MSAIIEFIDYDGYTMLKGIFSPTEAKQIALDQILREVLGKELGLVRGLYFDKPPQKSWALPWHQDRAIAVKNNKLPSADFAKPTTKAGVPHVEAPVWLSEQILFTRIHLDPMLDENGPLQVLPGSHRADKPQELVAPVTLHADPGDVLLMRPLLFHRSSEALPTTSLHRRVLQLEFAGCPALPDGYEWQTFVS
jgi:ectoine hydroxylase-related dioxygenase (phytanoyl-CoA dioxygenase family)